jgi:hypothetical protein
MRPTLALQVSANMEGDGIEREEMLFDLRRLNSKIHVLVLWVNRSVLDFLVRDIYRDCSPSSHDNFSKSVSKHRSGPCW